MLKYHIQTIEVGSAGAADITFNNIPQDYDDLYIVSSARGTDGTGYGKLIFNSNTDGTKRRLYGQGSGSGASDTTVVTDFRVNGSDQTASTFSSSSITISNYSSSSQAKSYSVDSVNENNATYAVQQIVAGLANITAPITRVSMPIGGGLYTQHSSASLYGIKRGSDGKTEVASGGTITTSGGYTFHTFTTSGTFVANRNLQVDTLIVAGGGGGGRGETQTGTNAGGGGGGAGGYVAQNLTVNSGSYPIVVGGGGAGGPASTSGSSGTASSMFSVTAVGGGGGGENFTSGGTGGSGGGGGGLSGGIGGAGTSGQGNNGGNGGTSNSPSAGGGGGAAAAAANVTDAPTAGGAGLQWLNGTFYAGGGGGGGYTVNAAGGVGGGGASGLNTGNAVAGTANTGGGGGGSGLNASAVSGNSGAGGSGIVIIRYLTPA